MPDSFELIEKLSESPTTVVYKAEQKALDRKVLLKVLHKHLLGDDNLVKRFSREAKACAMLRSEHIVQVYDLEEFDGAPAIVMEFVEGESLRDFLIRTGDRSEEFAQKVAVGVLSALTVAHSKGIVHRDIKPGNILISEKGEVKVTDFGLAWVSSSPSLTVEGALIGTPAYMSPEQARGETLDHRTDLFSLGITLVEMLTGVQMFGGSSYSECLNKILSFRTDSLPQFSIPASERFQAFLARLLSADRNGRPSSAVDALTELRGAGTPAAERGGIVRSSRSKIAMAVAGLVIGLAAVYFLVLIPGNNTDQDNPALAQQNALVDTSRSDNSSTTVPDDGETQPQETGSIQPERSPASRTTRSEPTSNIPVISAQPGQKPELTDSGYVTISAHPWASVYVDNEFLGTTPIAGSIRVRTGSHQVTFSNPSFVPITRTIEVESNTQTPVDVNFMETAGFITIDARPWAEVYVDEQYRETTPLNTPLVVSAGRRKVRLHHPSFSDFETDLTIGIGDTLNVFHDFNETNGTK